MYKKIISGLLLVLLPSIIFAFAKKDDFQFYKQVTDINFDGTYYIDIDSDIESNSKKFLSDIRIYNGNEEIKYKIERERDIYQHSERDISLNIVQKNDNTYIIDLNKDSVDEYLNNIFVNTSSADFRRVVNVHGADLKEGPYYNLNVEENRGDLVYDLPEGNNLSIDFKYSNYKYLKLVFSGSEGSFQENGFYRTERKTDIISGEKDFLEVSGAEFSLKDNDQKIILDTKKDNLFFDQVKFNFDDKRFKRNYVLYSSDIVDAEILESGKRIDLDKHYWVKVNSGVFEKEIHIGNPVINLKNNKRFYRLDILNGDNEKLQYDSAIFEKFKRKIYFKAKSGDEIKVCYSAHRVDGPKYDFTLSKMEIESARRIILSKQEMNEDYVDEEKSIFDDNKWLIYVFISIVVFVLIFFVYKILKETKGKTDRDGMQI